MIKTKPESKHERPRSHGPKVGRAQRQGSAGNQAGEDGPTPVKPSATEDTGGSGRELDRDAAADLRLASPFPLQLTERQLFMVEQRRIQLGLRSRSETIRKLLEEALR